MDFYVVGAGMMGRGIVYELLKSHDVSRVVVGDLDVEKAKGFVSQAKDERLSSEFIDVRDKKDTVRKIKDFDVVVYAGWYELNMHITKAAIDAGVDYLDLGGLYSMTIKQLKLNEQAKKAGITAILGMGLSPGTTNILARYGAERMNQVKEIHIRVGIRQLTNKHTFFLPYSAYTLFDEFTLKPVVFKNGRHIKVNPFSGQEMINFPDPIGEVEVVHTLHSEIATLPKFINKGVEAVDFKIGFGSAIEDAFKTLIKLGLASTKPKIYKDIEVVPREFTAKCLEMLPTPEAEIAGVIRVEVIGDEEGEKSMRRFEIPAFPPTVYPGMTEISASIAGQMLAKGVVEAKGVLPPEACIDPKQYIAELAKRDIQIQEIVIRSRML